MLKTLIKKVSSGILVVQYLHQQIFKFAKVKLANGTNYVLSFQAEARNLVRGNSSLCQEEYEKIQNDCCNDECNTVEAFFDIKKDPPFGGSQFLCSKLQFDLWI